MSFSVLECRKVRRMLPKVFSLTPDSGCLHRLHCSRIKSTHFGYSKNHESVGERVGVPQKILITQSNYQRRHIGTKNKGKCELQQRYRLETEIELETDRDINKQLDTIHKYISNTFHFIQQGTLMY